ncbi:MAG: DUF2971 domain-containing protein [Marinomonas sp.]
MPDLDWRWHEKGPPDAMYDATILGSLVGNRIVAVTHSSGAKTAIPTVNLIKNWIEHSIKSLDRYQKPPPDFHQQNLFDAHDTNWTPKDQEYVYHYTSWDTARSYILSGKKTMRFGSIDHMNDPLEFNNIQMPLYGVPRNDRDMPRRMLEAISWATKHGIQLLCTTKDQLAITSPHENGLLFHSAAVRGFARPPMWNHYGGGHEGVCLIFDRSKLNQNIVKAANEKGRLFNEDVTYTKLDLGSAFPRLGGKFKLREEMSEWNEGAFNEYARRIVLGERRAFFATKHDDWQYECETRWVFASDTLENLLVPIKNALSGIVVGCDFDCEHHDAVRALANAFGVPVRRIWWNNGIAVTPAALGVFETGGRLEAWEKKAKVRRQERSRG